MPQNKRKAAGTIYPRGDRFVAQLPESLGRRSRTVDTEDEGREWIDDELARARLGIGAGVESLPGVRLRGVVQTWLETAEAHGLLFKTTTLYAYGRVLRLYVIDARIGRIPIGDVLPTHLTAAMAAAPANSTRRLLATALSSFFDWADRNRYTPYGNPYRRSDAPLIAKRTEVEPRDCIDEIWTPAQLVEFLEFEHDPVYRDYWAFCAATAARRGEAIGLEWSLVDLDQGVCWFSTNVTVAGGKAFAEATPKNRKKRRVPLPPIITEMLIKRREDQARFRSTARSWQGDWVFDRRVGWAKRGAGTGIHLNPTSVTQRFQERSMALGLPALTGPHALRRIFNTIARGEGVDASVRSRALGHTARTTEGRFYDKVTDAELRETFERLSKVLFDGHRF
jgi:integrase